ncbi:MAG: DNA-binding protein [Deltaproteobacteria bacterium]|nr:DNA-binding protein [Deltaproteobacteria bacterium]
MDQSTESFVNLCVFHILDGLCRGLSLFSGPTRAALIYALEGDDPVRVYDPQGLLRGHEPILEEVFLRSGRWTGAGIVDLRPFEQNAEGLQLSGLITFGARSSQPFYQMWFTEHHPDLCSTGPTERWLEQAAWQLTQELGTRNVLCVGTAGHVLHNYARHAVRDHIVDERVVAMGPDTQLRIYPILDTILAVSRTPEEGFWPMGRLVFAEPGTSPLAGLVVSFPEMERPLVDNAKHVRKMLQAVENPEYYLASDGLTIAGIGRGPAPRFSLTADFQRSHGFLYLEDQPVCSFTDGHFRSTNRRAKLVQLEECLLESKMSSEARHDLFRVTADIVHHAQALGRGCGLVVDLREKPTPLSGQHLDVPLDLLRPGGLDLAKSLAMLDGALHIGADLKVHGFACLLDGLAVAGENRARGARFNSALRFTAVHESMIVVAVSADRPVAIIQGGVELTARCEWKPVWACSATPPLLGRWLKDQSL